MWEIIGDKGLIEVSTGLVCARVFHSGATTAFTKTSGMGYSKEARDG